MKKMSRVVCLVCFLCLLFCLPAVGVASDADESLSLTDSTTFSDEVFRAWLKDKYDNDGDADGSLSATEVSNITALDIKNCNASTIDGLSKLTDLSDLDVSNCPNLIKLDASSCEKLIDLDVSNCEKLSELDASNCGELDWLKVSKCANLSKVNVSGCEGLYYLKVYDGSISTLDVSSCVSLCNLEVPNCQLSYLDVSKCMKSGILECKNNALTALDLSENSEISEYSSIEEQVSSQNIEFIPNGTKWCFNLNTTVFADPSKGNFSKVDNVQCWDSMGELIPEEDYNYNKSTGELEFDSKPTSSVTITYDYDTGYTGDYDHLKTMSVKLLPITSTVTVTDGTVDDETSGEYKQGDTVTIIANPPASGQVFTEWTTDNDIDFTDATSATTTFTMPASAVTVKANYDKVYTLTVTDGTVDGKTSGEYKQGDTVTIIADEKSGMSFREWTTEDGIYFDDESSATTTFIMPALPVTVKANYDDKVYTLTVTDGTVDGETSGDYKEGASVTIIANPPASGQVFTEWTTDNGITFADANSATTTFTMPAYAVAITAEYGMEATPIPIVYSVQVSGGNGVNEQTVIADGLSIIIGTVQGDFDKFVDLYIEGKKLTKDVDYTAHEGSVVITLQPSYIKTLAYGTHTFTVHMTDGLGSFDVTVAEPATITYPETGDASNLLLSLLFMGVGIGCLIGFIVHGKKKA